MGMLAQRERTTGLLGAGLWQGRRNRLTSTGPAPRAAQAEVPGPACRSETRDDLIADLCGQHARLAPRSPDDTYDAGLLLPPAYWINDQLAELGVAYRVQAVDGYRYEIFELAAATSA
jgi:hypothetical protein